MPADLGYRDTEIDRRIEDARAVEMQTQPFRSRELARTRQIVERQHFAGLGILQAQQAGLGKMRIIGLDRGLDPGKVERAVRLVVQRLRLDAAEHRRPAAFVLVGMALLADDVFVAALAVGEQSQKVALRPAADEERGFRAEALRRDRFEAVDGRILAVDVIPDFRGRHRRAHLGGRTGHRVAAEVNRLHVSTLSRLRTASATRCRRRFGGHGEGAHLSGPRRMSAPESSRPPSSRSMSVPAGLSASERVVAKKHAGHP